MGNFLSDLFDPFTGNSTDKAANASVEAAQIAAQGEREALDYLKSVEAVPQQFREGSLQQLGGLYGLEGGTGSQQDLIDKARASPLYAAITGTRDAGEQAILRNASATGGLRSGNVQNFLADYNQRLDERALLSSYAGLLQGLQGLAGIPSNANNIAAATAAPAETLAQGKIAAANAQTTGGQNQFSNLLGLGNLAIGAYQAFSDRRLKKNIRIIIPGKFLNWYEWDWNDEAGKLGFTGRGEGVMADEVAEVYPDMVTEHAGYNMVDYGRMANV